jgi:hypothetical protein
VTVNRCTHATISMGCLEEYDDIEEHAQVASYGRPAKGSGLFDFKRKKPSHDNQD